MFRSPRLEALFGKRIDQITFADVKALCGNPAATETAELDYKKLVHAQSEKDKTEFRKDAIAMGNSGGGILLIGVEEDSATATPARVPGVDVSEPEQRRLRSLLHEVSPFLPVAIEPLKDPKAQDQRGVLLVVIEGSAMAPHALLSTVRDTHHKDGWMRFPVRDGASTRWMKEPEVATRYRDRFAHGRSVGERLGEVELECLLNYEERAEASGGGVVSPAADARDAAFQHRWPTSSALPVLVVSLAPEIPGRMVINLASLLEFQRTFQTESVLLGRSVAFEWVDVAPGRLVGGIGSPNIGMYAEFHQDGSGSFLVSLFADSKQDGQVKVAVYDVVFYLLSALRCLGRHARDRARASGQAALRLSLLGDIDQAEKAASMLDRDDPYRISLTSHGDYGSYANLRSAIRAVGDAFAHVDDLVVDGPALVSAAAMVANEACHAFGLAEVPLLDVSGSINLPRWSFDFRPTMAAWAQQAGVPSAV